MIVTRGKLSMMFRVIISAVLVFSLLIPLIAEEAYAASSRAAVVEEVEGTVHLKKAGGSKPYRLFKRMTVNDGDLIITEAKSSVTLQVVDRKDEITIGENSEVYIADLLDADGAETEVKVWSGSLYSKVSELGGSDQYKISTPNATMGVRGTHFFVGYDQESGKTWVQVFSGIVRNQSGSSDNTSGDSEDSGEGSDIYPSMQGTFLDMIDEENQEIRTEEFITVLDIPELDPAIIEAILRNKQEIDEENNEYFNNVGEGVDSTPVEESELDRYRENVENVINWLLNQNIERNRLTEEDIQNIIDRAQAEIDWDREYDMEYSDEEERRLAERRAAEQRREQQRQQMEQRRQEEAQRKQDLLERLEQQRNQQQQQNEEATNDRRDQAVNNYLDQLTPEERARFEERVRGQLGDSSPDPEPVPTRGRPRGGNPSDPEPTEPAHNPSVELKAISEAGADEIVLAVILKDFPDTLHGAELHILFNELNFNVGTIEADVDHIFDNSVDHAKIERGSYTWEGYDEPTYTTEIVYSILSVGDVVNDAVSADGEILLKIPLMYIGDDPEGPSSVLIDGLLFVDREGNEISHTIHEQVWHYEF